MYNSSKLRIGSLILVIGVLTASVQAAPQQGNSPSEGETMHVLVGKSVVINVQAPMSRVLSSNPAVVETLATSPTQVVVEGKAAGASSLILWDGSGHSQILDVVVDLDISALRNTIQRTYPNSQLDVQADAGRVILTGSVTDPKVVDELTKMAGAYSTQVVNSLTVGAPHERQVLLEVKFAEVDRSALQQLGFNFFSTGAGSTIGTTTTGQFGQFGEQKINDVAGHGAPSGVPFTNQQTISQVLNIFLFNFDTHFGAVVQDLEQRNILQILAEPNLMAVNGQKASFLAGGEFPFPVVQPGQGFTAVTIVFKPFGVRLDFTGIIQNDDTIRLHVAPEVSALDFSNALTLSGFVVPAITTRKAETDIELKDGQSFGIAGLLDHRATTQLSKVPGIGDIPILGQFFRSRNINKNNTELMVLVTPHIVDPIRGTMQVPPLPKLAVPYLDQGKFDKQAPGNKDAEKSPNTLGAK
jgi:pilus assembly protein CpaC